MKVIKPSYEILTPINGMEILRFIERIGRTAYKSENLITEDSAPKFIKMLVDNGHLSVIEHVSLTVLFTVDRGTTHELVRHRLASFTQSSTRYCNYSKGKFGSEITVIEPLFFERNSYDYVNWYSSCKQAENTYMKLLEYGATPEKARSVLPNSLASELVMTADLREWRHVLNLRSSPAAHPQCREVIVPLLNELKERIPIVFDDIVAG